MELITKPFEDKPQKSKKMQKILTERSYYILFNENFNEFYFLLFKFMNKNILMIFPRYSEL